MLFIGLQLTVCPDHSERKSTQIYANREPIHPRLAPLKSLGAGGSLGIVIIHPQKTTIRSINMLQTQILYRTRGSRVAWSILERLGRFDPSSNLGCPIS